MNMTYPVRYNKKKYTRTLWTDFGLPHGWIRPQADAVTALDEQVRGGTETHLYLTDGQLWAQRESELRGETERMSIVAVGDIIRTVWTCQARTETKPYLESAAA